MRPRFLICFLLTVLLAPFLSQSQIYITPSGAGTQNGSSWANAAPGSQLQAFIAAPATTTIYVARGTYKPTITANRDTAFAIVRNNIKIYGGYDEVTGTRDIAANPTILSGDIGAVGNDADDSYHVMVIADINGADSVVVDGFTITKGKANSGSKYYGTSSVSGLSGAGISLYNNNAAAGRITVRNCHITANVSDNYGAGIYNQASSPTIAGCTIDGNMTYFGGAIFNVSSSAPSIMNCVISSNTALTGGGGIHNRSVSPANISNCSFTGNSATTNGGAIYNENSSAIISGCSFTSNNSQQGGAIFSNGTSSPVITGCNFKTNTAAYGGAIFTNATFLVTVTSCTFIGNSSTVWGGGIMGYTNSKLDIRSCFFSGNNSSGFGGGIANYSGATSSIINCVFSSNASVNGGSGVFSYQNTKTTVTNCTFDGNTTPGKGKSVHAYTNATVIISNSIIDANGLGQDGATSLTAAYSLIPGGYAGTGNINSTPFFADSSDADGADNIFGTADDGLQLSAASPALNKGSNDSIPSAITTDVLNAARIQQDQADMGAYEGFTCPSYNTLYVNNSIGVSGNGSSWATAFKELRDALKAANNCSNITTINVARGTYMASSDYIQRDTAFVILRNNLKIYGGYDAATGIRNSKVNTTILSGDLDRFPLATFNDSWHVVVITGVTGTDSVILDGFTVSGGGGAGATKTYNGISVPGINGGGICMVSNTASIAIRNCIIRDNGSSSPGAGIYNAYCSPEIAACVFMNNISNSGGAVYNNGVCSPIITNCLFVANRAYQYGAAVANDLSANTAITNCTFQGNISGDGTPVYDGHYNTAGLTNCTFWGNTPSTGWFNSVVSYCNLQPGYTVGGFSDKNIFTNPLFIDPSNPAGADNIWGTADDGLIPQAGSDLVNNGNNTAITAGYDFAGAARVQENRVDIGAYEGYTCPSFNKLYVDNNVAVVGGGYGSSWGNAFRELRNALKAVRECGNISEIVVAKGTYYPASDLTLDSSFAILRGNIKIYGGYDAATGTRDIAANPTVLNGYLGTDGTNNYNSSHIITIAGVAADSVVIDGFTVVNGNSQNTTDKVYGSIIIPGGKGGGAYLLNNVGGKLAIRNCLFDSNKGFYDAGAIYSESSAPNITSCIFSSNYTGGNGGAVYNKQSFPVIINSLFTGNTANGNGGVIYSETGCISILGNCTAFNNTALGGSVIYNVASSASVNNSVIWNNANPFNTGTTIVYSNVQDGYAGTGNISTNPYFFNSSNPAGADNTWRTADDGLQLFYGSNAINSGSNMYVGSDITTDITGYNTRINLGKVDMGAYERTCFPYSSLYVNGSVATTGDGSSWPGAFKELRQALSAANQCPNITSIYVAKGTYLPTDDTNRDSAFAFYRNNIKLYGGYDAATGTRNITANTTILSGDIGTAGDNGDNSYHVVVIGGITGADSLVVDGFTVTKGNGNGNSGKSYNGAPVYQSEGGGIYLHSNNAVGGKIAVRNCRFTSNTSTYYGGGFYNQLSSPTVTNCVMDLNSTINGGGMFNYNASSPVVSNCLFTGNSAGNGAAMQNLTASNPVITNCTFQGNTSSAAIVNNSSSPVISNSIIWGNTGAFNNTPATVNYSIIQGSTVYTGTNNYNLDPQFVNDADADGADNIYGTADDGLMLSACSPAINQGNNAAISLTADFKSETRIAYSTVDPGAYEVESVDLDNSTWKGINTNWNDIINWCGGYIPSATTNVTIPSSLINYPVINTAADTKDILLASGTSVTVSNGSGLSINGSYTNNGGSIINNGSWVMAGNAAAQRFPGVNATITSMNNLEIHNPSGMSINKSFRIKGDLILDAGNTNIENNVLVTLNSDAVSTARVAPVSPGATLSYSGNGKFAVERYIPAQRSWRLLTSPLTSTASVYSSWQNNGMYEDGKGMLVTGASPSSSNGLDVSEQNNYSLFYWNEATQALAAVADTKDSTLSRNAAAAADNRAYLAFVRGDRLPANTLVPNTNTTTLVSTGKLQTGTQVFTANSLANKYTLIGNPYASPVDLNSIGRQNLVKRFYVMDPSLNEVGGYVMLDDLDGDNVFTKSVAGSAQDKNIQSGQAFYVQTLANAAATVTFNESCKSAVNNVSAFRPQGLLQKASIRTGLYIIDLAGSAKFADEALVECSDQFSAGLNYEDAVKFNNTNETFSMLRNGAALCAERRPGVTAGDTLFFKLAKSGQKMYRLVIDISGMIDHTLQAFLEDSYLNTASLISLDGKTQYDFAVNNDAASANSTRFRIVFKKAAAVLPVTFKTIRAVNSGDENKVQWEVENELNIASYTIEKSTDGISFTAVGSVAATGGTVYSWNDQAPAAITYYRVQSNDLNGEKKYSETVKAAIAVTISSARVFPNPATGNVIHLQLNNMPEGRYIVQLINSSGQVVHNGALTHKSEVQYEVHPSFRIPAGQYSLLLTTPLQPKLQLNVQVQ
ncbi:MAG: choice-of-anchor Q domain-containing protein [Ferruginibacter sp.]